MTYAEALNETETTIDNTKNGVYMNTEITPGIAQDHIIKKPTDKSK